MQILDSVSAIGGGATAASTAVDGSQATDAFGLSFEALLKIVLTQLTYQDPLKPMDNFQFVSQLAQFSQIQQSQQMVGSLEILAQAQTTGQATGLLGREVDIGTAPTTLSGKVTAVVFSGASPTITIETKDGQTVSGISLANVSQIRESD